MVACACTAARMSLGKMVRGVVVVVNLKIMVICLVDLGASTYSCVVAYCVCV